MLATLPYKFFQLVVLDRKPTPINFHITHSVTVLQYVLIGRLLKTPEIDQMSALILHCELGLIFSYNYLIFSFK